MASPDLQLSTPGTRPWKRNVALFLTGQTISLFGSLVVQFAVMWYVTFETRSGLAVALYAIAAFAPQGVIAIFGGVLADRINRRVLVMISDATIALTTLALALLMLSGVTELWIILLAVAVRSVGAGVQTPAVSAMIPQVTPPEHLMRVNGIFHTMQSSMTLLAPVAAGVVFGVFGIVPVFFIDVVSAAIGILLLSLVAVPTLQAIAEKTTTYRADLIEGARYVATHRVVRWLLTVFAIIFLLTIAPSYVTPLMVARSFGSEVWMVTVLEAAFSIGMMLGGVVVSTLLARSSRIALILFSTFGFGLTTIALGFSTDLIGFYALIFLFGLLVPPLTAPFMTLMQESVRPEMHGRVFSYVSIVMALATPIGMAVFGPLADVWRVETLLVVAGAACIVVMLVAISVPSGRAAIAAARTADAERAAAKRAAAAPRTAPAEGSSDAR
ncbi:MFS transporter [uncultured Schumannella sp.]|uniref:MFS transporter n=1 Tax=uncultured Schumannella sp. TaxID=1195956 RepID=UPI0025E8F8D7|nr:MFS transporter [uncultured Schumannella sp.]